MYELEQLERDLAPRPATKPNDAPRAPTFEALIYSYIESVFSILESVVCMSVFFLRSSMLVCLEFVFEFSWSLLFSIFKMFSL